MVPILELVIGAAVTVAGALLIEEAISFLIRRAAKAAGASPTVIRDVGTALRVIAGL